MWVILKYKVGGTLTNTKLVKYYKKLMEDVDTEYPEYEKIIRAYEDRIRQIKRGVNGKLTRKFKRDK